MSPNSACSAARSSADDSVAARKPICRRQGVSSNFCGELRIFSHLEFSTSIHDLTQSICFLCLEQMGSVRAYVQRGELVVESMLTSQDAARARIKDRSKLRKS